MLPAGPGGPPARAIDRTVVHGLAATMGREFVTELIDIFQEDSRALVTTLREALAAADVDAFRRAAHSLKSTSESLGATALGALARELEGRARAGRMENAGERVGELAAAHEAAARELEEVRRALSA
jgi:HPt (histidine-containing phosphotransfer) domain-containing protein